ncbi:MAG: branched-chain amino acid transport system II carrier protein [Synergistaceae bacterium]|uniref:branched-chain amino acid transport system II carrier protein n=1 Tax=Aminivibrio sp. TaxID=1872489 RepID=UPI002A22E20A|nr:branched-chain amino acid transport system II carrier protein [Synergistaceae bacterium]MDD3391489.1 branched-chain amino acid transport system II carrier protein [Synergistaceae bacterium]MDD3689691.1 branched-chain amino acid transport system II carrier protein [Synergistaceae bacterium]MDD4021012.1 branched-chain amino acid transport system II carrier protein [Synergistaceae bacterium]
MNRQDLTTAGVITTGLALFSAHFGVGDIIFPGKLGFDTGSLWLTAGLGYFFVNTIIAFLGYLAIAKDKIGIAHMAGEILSPFWGKVFGAILMLVVGPVFILPRVASATHEMSILPFFPNVHIAATLAVFFLLNAYVCLNRTAVVDRLGKFLSPALVLFIAAIAIKGILFPIAGPVAGKTTAQAAFGVGFNFGYNTMNAIAAVLMGGWILNDFSMKGITEERSLQRNLVRVGFLTVVLLGVTQISLTWLGASAGGVYSEATLGDLPLKITTHLYGTIGMGIFAALMGLACFTTSAGLTAAAGTFFEQITNGGIKYKPMVIASSICGFAIGMVGLSRIVGYTVPFLSLLYPSLIVIILGTFFLDVGKYRSMLLGGILMALLFGFFDAAKEAGFTVAWMQQISSAMPLSAQGFPWIVPTIAGLAAGFLLRRSGGK